MNAREAVALATYARAARPHQQWSEHTPDVWADVLDDIRYDDAREAVKQLAKSSAYIDIEAIRDTVKSIRAARLERYGDESTWPEFPGDPDDGRAWVAWKKAMVAAIADGAEPAQAAETDTVRKALPDLRRVLPSPPPLTRDDRKLDERVVQHHTPPRPASAVPGAVAERLETERVRQLRALEAGMNAHRDAARDAER